MGGIFGPGPTKPSKIIAQQQGANKQDAALMQSQRPDQFGTGFQQQWTTDSSGRPVQTTSLSPENQFLYQQGQGIRANLGAGIGGLVGNYAGQLAQPFDMTSAGFGAALGGSGLINQMNQPFWADQENREINRLRNQGLVPGNAGDESSAYNKSIRQLGLNQFLQFQNAILPWQQQAASQALQSDQNNQSRINTLFPMTGPSFPISPQNLTGYNPGQTNVGQITQNYDQQNQARADAIGKLIGTVVMGGMGLPFGAGTLGSSLGGTIGNGIGNFFGMTPSPTGGSSLSVNGPSMPMTGV